MIFYELAKELKDAGFPQKIKGNHITPSDEIIGYEQSFTAYLPSLSELIGACGNENFSLNEVNGKWICKGGEKYTAVVGNTPEEAVAKLWLALNKK